MDPLKWFQNNVINKTPKGGAMPKPGGAIVPTGAGQLLNPKGIQQITTNLRVPGGGAVPGGGIGMLGARGQNFGLLDGPIDMLGRLILRQDAFIPSTQKKTDTKKVEPVATTTGLNTGTGNRDAKLDPNATEQYASNFKAGQANMGNIQDMYASNKAEDKYKDTDKTALQLWAQANPALAQKAFEKAEAKAVKNGKTPFNYDAEETFKPSDIPEADRQNPIEQAKARGITNLKDEQKFKDDAMTALLTNFGNTNVEPFVEGINLPTTTNYAGAFNQTDVPDLQSMMNMGDKLENFGYGDLAINPQNFMSSFRGNVIDTSKNPETSGLSKTVDLPKVNNLLATLGEDEYFKRLDGGLLTEN